MSDLSNDPPIPEESVNIEESASPWTMLVTMVLLISGFLLASTMMLHYSSPKTENEDETAEVPFNFSALIAKGKSYAANLKKPEKAEVMEPEKIAQSEESAISKIFGNRSDTVRWPKLKLTGFGSATEGNGGFAIINGKQIQPGQLIDGKARLNLIRSHDVVVEYMGETKTLIVDVQD